MLQTLSADQAYGIIMQYTIKLYRYYSSTESLLNISLRIICSPRVRCIYMMHIKRMDSRNQRSILTQLSRKQPDQKSWNHLSVRLNL